MTFSLMIFSSQAQEKVTFDWYCNYSGEELKDDVYGFESDKDAVSATKRIVDYTGIVQNFVIKAANVPNASATIVGEQRAIFYNQDFMLRVRDTTKTDWAAISIMAHEVGHHLQGHTIQRGGSRPEIELEADRYSGFVLQKMGATLDQSQAAMKAIGSDQGSSTHPAKSARLAAITNGWRASRDLKATSPDIKTPPDKTPESQVPPVVGDPGVPHPDPTQPTLPQYVSRCVFPNDPIAYFVTANNDIVGIPPNGQVTLVGKKTPPTASGFAWMYQTGYVTYGVSFDGRIYSRAPNGMPFQVGYVTNP